MRVALVHDWLTGMRGGEKVLERLCRLFPDAPIHTLVWNRGAVSPAIESHPIRTSFLQRLPGVATRYRWFLPLFPRAIESFDLAGFDAVISTSHAVARAVRTPPETFHLSYVFTPMRYVWDLEAEYFPPGRFPWPLSWYVRRTCARLRRWDRRTSDRPQVMIAISRHVADRIARHYGRAAEVIHPPVDLERFAAGAARAGGRGDYLLMAGALAPYKRADLALAACRRLGRRLVVVGSGQEERRLRPLAGPDVEFHGWASDETLARLYAGAQAVLFPGEEDFGIVPLEAMASGCPVVAYGRGGALESVGRDAPAESLSRVARGQAAVAPGGVLFGSQTVEGLVDAVRLLDGQSFDPAALTARARPFAAEAFDHRFREAFERHYRAWQEQAVRRRPDSRLPRMLHRTPAVR